VEGVAPSVRRTSPFSAAFGRGREPLSCFLIFLIFLIFL
jgi:hypothetical protein